MQFDPETATDLLTEIREGMTLQEACGLEGMPERLEVYDWLRDPSLKIGKQSFASLYNQACMDRALSWQDQAARIYDGLDLNGKNDAAKLKWAADRASLLLRIAKEQRETIKIVTPSQGNDIQVTITTFARPPDEPV